MQTNYSVNEVNLQKNVIERNEIQSKLKILLKNGLTQSKSQQFDSHNNLLYLYISKNKGIMLWKTFKY